MWLTWAGPGREGRADSAVTPIGAKAVKLLKNGQLISYPWFPHGMPTTEAATINADRLAFIQS